MKRCKEPIESYQNHRIKWRPQSVLSAVTNHLDDQLLGVLNAWAELCVSLLHMGADEEQPAVPDLGQRQSVMEVSDAAGSWKVLQTRAERDETGGKNVIKYLRQYKNTPEDTSYLQAEAWTQLFEHINTSTFTYTHESHDVYAFMWDRGSLISWHDFWFVEKNEQWTVKES